MRIFAIRSDSLSTQKDLAYLFYYEIDKHFYIELPENADEWQTPIYLSIFARRKQYSIDAYHSMVWVRNRIVPESRQNIIQILKDNNLKEYDEFELMMLAMGRCEQDEYYLTEIDEDNLPASIIKRFDEKVEDIVSIDNGILIVFRNGKVKRVNLYDYISKHRSFNVLLQKPELIKHVKIQTGGYGISWDINLNISNIDLFKMGEDININASELISYTKQNIITSSEAAEILNCSRQNIDDLIKRNKIHPIKSANKTTLFLRSEIEQRNWK